MHSPQKNTSTPNPNLPNGLSPDLLLSLASGSVLVGLVSVKALSEALRRVGELSEEVFRGDRLPLLTIPTIPQSHPDSDAERETTLEN